MLICKIRARLLRDRNNGKITLLNGTDNPTSISFCNIYVTADTRRAWHHDCYTKITMRLSEENNVPMFRLLSPFVVYVWSPDTAVGTFSSTLHIWHYYSMKQLRRTQNGKAGFIKHNVITFVLLFFKPVIWCQSHQLKSSWLSMP